MASKFKLVFFVFIVSLVISWGVPMVYGVPQVPGYFIFGDSLVDNGNNNDLVTQSKANCLPYGIDFPEGPTGRFTNGRNIADVIAELLGFENYIPPFATARGKKIFRGVNYGSGAAGIRDETGQQMGARISLNRQLLNHGVTMLRLAALLGSKRLAKQYLNKCLYTVAMGNNDYLNNYFLPEYYPTSRIYTPERYAKALVRQYSRQLKTLYKFGARKVGIFAVGYLGCTPGEIALYGTNRSTCVDMINNATILFNDQLKNLVDDLNDSFSDAKFIFIESLLSYKGLLIDDIPCCSVSTTIGKGQCAPNTIPCSNRTDYVFWDAFHPTQGAVLQDAASAYSAMSPLYTASLSDILGPKLGDEYIGSASSDDILGAKII